MRATTGDIDIDSLKAVGGGLNAWEGTVRVGLPYKGKVRPSVISKYAYGISGKSGVVIENMKALAGPRLVSESGDVSLRNSKLRSYGTVRMEPVAPGGVCDLTGTDVGEDVVVDTSACTTVVGP